MNIPALICVSLLGAGALAMIVGSLLKKQWATEGKKTSLSIYLLYLFAMAGSGWTWYDSIHKARALAEGNRYTLATYEKVSGIIQGGHKVREFGFYVNGVKYSTTTTYPKYLGVSNPLRIIVRYAVSNPEYNKAFGDEFVPTWVLSPPEKIGNNTRLLFIGKVLCWILFICNHYRVIINPMTVSAVYTELI